MFCKAIRRNTTPFVWTLYHSTLRWAISRNATHFFMYAVPFHITQSHFTQRYAVGADAVLFDIALSHFTQRYTVLCVHCTIRHYAEPFHATLHRLCTHNFMFQIDIDNQTIYHLAKLLMFEVFCFMKEN